MITWYLIFWFTIFLVFHSYVLYPWILQLLASRKQDPVTEPADSSLPPVTVLMSVYNEAAILREKLDSILASHYPAGKLKILVGSDASDDDTHQVLADYEKKHKSFRAIIFRKRQGKPAVINQLVDETTDELLILTDAKAIFQPSTVRSLTAHFQDPETGIVGGNILNRTVEKDGVSIQEKAFMSREILMKYREGLIWGATVGVYGAIYAIRKALYTPVPEGFAVDDFFVSLNVTRQKKKALLDIHAITHEEVPNLLSEEYRRKVRIATGNYRNLRYFGKELLTPWKGASFAYISHKVIRWLGPFIILAFLLANAFLYHDGGFYRVSMLTAVTILCLPIFDFFLSKIGIHIVILRFVRHFVTMHIALLHGFINNLGGIRRDVWQPTNR